MSSSSSHMTKAVFDSLVVEVVKKCDEAKKMKEEGHMISVFVAGWAAQHGLTAHEMPNVFRVISGTFTSNSQVYIAAGMWRDAAKFEAIKELVAEAVEHDKAHFVRMKLEAIADAAAAALAFNS
jgi:biotin synthase-like enzyme